MWFCELAVVALLLSSQGMVPARAAELPPAAAEDCGGEDQLDRRSENCDRAGDTAPPCEGADESDRETGEGDGSATGPTRAAEDEDAEDSEDHAEDREANGDERRPEPEGAAREGDAGAAEEAEPCESPAGAPHAGPLGEGDERGTAEEPEDDETAAGEAPTESPSGAAPVVADDAARDPNTGLPVPESSAHCSRRHVLLDCSVGPGSVPNAGSSGDDDPGDERRPRTPDRGSEPPEQRPERRPAGMDDPLATGPASWRPTGALSTDDLMAALNRGGGEVTPEDYAPFIIAGRASWVDTWGAPRFGPGATIRQHEGQDVFCDHGAPVLAAQEGIVEFDFGGLGGRVARVHRPDGAYWYYAHLSRWNTDDFDSGDSVVPGDVIGYCGNTGNAATTPPHVHFGLYGPDGRAADPMAWLVRWLRAAERSAGLRRLSSAADPVELELQALLPNHDVAVAPAPRPLRAPAIDRFDTAGDAPQSLRRAGVSQVVEAWTPTRPSAGDRALEFVGIGALLVTVYMMRARWNGDRFGGSAQDTPSSPGDRSGR